MPAIKSINDIDLTPIPGKTYFNTAREWREDFIYFLMVDRFHDDSSRQPVLSPNRTDGIQTRDNFYGGKIKGITRNLDYIAGLGCTAIWLSPVFENNAGAYHGYNINNYLDVDPHFGTKQDLVDLVQAAHGYRRNGQAYPIRVILDVVINHSGDNWEYPGDNSYKYFDGQQFPFDRWRRDDRPLPVELRNPNYYHRRGSIQNYDDDTEAKTGDIVSLKDYWNDDDQAGSELINILIKAHCYWIREADLDGFRVDAVKHMGALACSRFSSMVREYAYSLGKRSFFLFGEVATADDDVYNSYIGQNTSVKDDGQTVYFGLNSVLDFRLAEGAGEGGLRDVIKAFVGPDTLFHRLEEQQERALNRGELGRYLVTFVDNHDSFWQPAGRFGSGAPQEQIIAAIGYLICALGTACIYYGTEQGFQGQGGDNQIREAMFDLSTPGRNLLNTQCRIYQEIAKIAHAAQSSQTLKYGRMYYRQISDNGVDFGFPYGKTFTLAFSRILYPREVLVAYNVADLARNDCVIVDGAIHKPGDKMTFLYGGQPRVTVGQAPNGALFVRLNLGPRQFAILQ
jgi:glycosidase